MKLINPFSRKNKKESKTTSSGNTFIEVKYSKLDNIGKYTRVEIPNKEEIDNQITNMNNQLTSLNNEITNIKNKVNGIDNRTTVYKEYNNPDIEYEKTEIKPGLYLYTLKSIPKHLESINHLKPNTSYYIEYWIAKIHFPDGTWGSVNLKYKTEYQYSIDKTSLDIGYERNRNHKSISFISEVNFPNQTIRGLIHILCFPIW